MAKFDKLFAAWGERETIAQAEILDLAIATVLRLNGLTHITVSPGDVAETMRTHTIGRTTDEGGWTVAITPKETTHG